VAEENLGKNQDSRRLTQEAQELKDQLDAKDAERQQLQATKQEIEQQLAGQEQRRAEAEAEKGKYDSLLQQALAAAQAVSDIEGAGLGQHGPTLLGMNMDSRLGVVV
jgi:septal ring factor EnvC (AmiA/AmiB activator)